MDNGLVYFLVVSYPAGALIAFLVLRKCLAWDEEQCRTSDPLGDPNNLCELTYSLLGLIVFIIVVPMSWAGVVLVPIVFYDTIKKRIKAQA